MLHLFPFDMPLPLDMMTLQWVYFFLLVAYTIHLAIVMSLAASHGLGWWLVSNVLTAAASVLFIMRNPAQPHDLTYLVPTSLLIASASLKFLAIVSSGKRRDYYLPIALVSVAVMLGYKALDVTGHADLRLSLGVFTLGIGMGAISWAAADNPRWRGIPGRMFFIVTFLISSIMLLVYAVHVVLTRQTDGFFAQDSQMRVLIMVLQLIASHTGLTALVVGRQTRALAISAARLHELQTRRASVEAHSKQMQALAEQRHSMLEILTHEVRQPLNNAQAALEEMTRTTSSSSGSIDRRGAQSLISRTRGIIDDVVLALSNAIIGAGLIERQATRAFHPVDAAALLQLAKGDCHLESQPRIIIEASDAPLFVAGDPVLLRLAFRNLLENALKYSPSSSPVIVRLAIDEKRLGVALQVLNQPVNQFIPDKKLFDRSTRGSSNGEGKGLGLFITREIALLHEGTVTAQNTRDGLVRFELFLPL